MISEKQLAKIRAVAEDQRGDPAIRAVAQATLKRYAKKETIKSFVDPRHPGMKTSAEYDRYRFMDLGSWSLSSKGNPTHTIYIKGRLWRVVLFQHKKGPTYGWMRVDAMVDDAPEFSAKFQTMAEAHADLWKTLNGT